MSREHPRVSVVIPCYNKEPYLRETLDSALGQARPVEEVIVVDDGSTDGSAAIAESYGPPVRVLRQENRGESVARNRGIEEAAGDWIALLDADDRWEPEKLERQLAALEAAEEREDADGGDGDGEGFVCLYTDVYRFRAGKRGRVVSKPEHHASPRPRIEMLCDWCVNPSSALVRAEALETVRFPPDFQDSEDMIFFAELREHGRFLRVPEPLTGYRYSDANQSRRRRHFLKSVEARYRWLMRRGGAYSDEERRELRERLAGQLVHRHNLALWNWRDLELVRECRQLYFEIHPEPERAPESFRRRLYPKWVYRAKDFVFERPASSS